MTGRQIAFQLGSFGACLAAGTIAKALPDYAFYGPMLGYIGGLMAAATWWPFAANEQIGREKGNG